MLRRIATGVEVVVAACVLVFLVMLFANSPTSPPAAPASAVEAAGGVDGGAVFGRSCAGCHGGDGSGGIGPRLAAGRVLKRFPDPAAQIEVVTNGRGGMPAFGSRLSEQEIAAVVDYTRTVLAAISP